MQKTILGQVLGQVLRPVLNTRYITDPGVGGGAAQSLTDQVRAAIFGNGERGDMWDVRDTASLFQTNLTSAPVTAVGQPIGRIEGIARPRTLGPELAPDFSSWADNTRGTWSVAGGKATSSGVGVRSFAVQDGGGVPGVYQITITVDSGAVTVFANAAGNTQVVSAGTATFIAGIRQTGGANFGFYVAGSNQAVVSAFSAKRLSVSDLVHLATAQRPAYASAPPVFADFDGTDDVLNVAFPYLGTGCTVARITPGGSPSILSGQTVNSSALGNPNWTTINADFCRYLIVDRALTGPETALVTAWLNEGATP